jgi:EF-hand domain-containing protein 1
MASNFPKLPGYTPTHDPTAVNWKKISHDKLEKNRNCNNKEVPLYAVPRPPKTEYVPEKTFDSKSFSQSVFQNPFGGSDIQEQFEPTYVKLDKQVLKFRAYFKEPIVESRLENWRVREVNIYFYLEDSTIMIIEAKQVNSGTPQGTFLKRQMVLKDGPIGSQSSYAIEDFRVGDSVNIHGRNFKIIDADQYTREFYENYGEVQPEAEELPVDEFTKALTKPKPKKDAAMLDYLEHTLGGGRVKSQKQFLDNDRRVLRFYTYSDGDGFIIHYYLADDTIEIREFNFANSGKHNFPLLLRRQKLPKQFSVGQPGLDTNAESYLTEEDIKPGEPIIAFGRVFTITGVDPFTKEFYKKNYNEHFPLGDVSESKPPEQVPLVIPEYNGFGDEEDTLGYVKKLLPKQPRKDFFKYVDNDKKILRYTARFNTQVPEDVDRRFIISYYLADDTLSIFEPAQKNSGIQEGKFLERRKYKNKHKGDAFI